jgi:hypothetical protein
VNVPLRRRLGSLSIWPAGMALTSWVYLWRTTPMHRREREGALPGDLPPPLPEWVDQTEIQRPQDGAGPLFRRRYRGEVVDGRWKAGELMQRVKADPNFVSPLALARFRKTQGPAWRMELGDEFLVRMPGPWDGPIRTIHHSPTSFRFATLHGHLEAGQIEWRARDEDGAVVFEIESWARAGDAMSALLHDHLRMAKEVQLHMWSSVVERVAERCGGRLAHGIDIETRRIDADAFAAPGGA